MSKHKFNNILLTGAAGALGEQLRKTLSQNCNLLKISDKEKLLKINPLHLESYTNEVKPKYSFQRFKCYLK